jgi:hypothetical protein
LEITYQVEETGWCGLLSSLLAEEQEALSGVCSPCSVLVCSLLVLLSTEVAGQSLALNRLGAEPEELLLEDQSPNINVKE